MEQIDGVWSRERAEQFLSERAIPVRIACHRPSGGLWMLSLWYRYADGELLCATGADAAVVKYLRSDPSVAFEVSTNDPPYRGVRGAGTALIDPDAGKSVLTDLLERYLGGTDSRLADQLLDPDRPEVAIEIEIERAYAWDFTERMRDAT